MKPVGLDRSAHRAAAPYAVVQLRQDNLAGDHFSLVGFQTQLKWGEQARVLQTDPGARAGGVRPLRHGPPQHLHQRTDGAAADRGRRGRARDLFFAGQVSGVEGYVESAASGLIAGRNAAALARGEQPRCRRARRPSARWRITCRTRIRALSADEHHVRHHAAARGGVPAPRRRRARTGSWRLPRVALDDLDAWIAAIGSRAGATAEDAVAARRS